MRTLAWTLRNLVPLGVVGFSSLCTPACGGTATTTTVTPASAGGAAATDPTGATPTTPPSPTTPSPTPAPDPSAGTSSGGFVWTAEASGRTQPVMSHLIETGKLTLEDVQEAERTLRKLARKDKDKA